MRLCHPMDCRPPGFSLHGILQARILEWEPCLPPGDLLDQGIKPTALMFSALASGFFFFTTSMTWEARWNGSVQFSSATQSCLTLCDPMNHSTLSLPVHHQLPEFTEIHVHRLSDVIQPSYPLLSPSSLACIPSQHQSLFQWVNSSLEVAKVLEFQL